MSGTAPVAPGRSPNPEKTWFGPVVQFSGHRMDGPKTGPKIADSTWVKKMVVRNYNESYNAHDNENYNENYNGAYNTDSGAKCAKLQ